MSAVHAADSVGGPTMPRCRQLRGENRDHKVARAGEPGGPTAVVSHVTSEVTCKTCLKLTGSPDAGRADGPRGGVSQQQARALLALQQATCDLREAVTALRRRCDEIEAICDAAGKGSSMHCPLGQPAQEVLKYAARRDALIDAATLLEIPAQEIAAASAVRRIT